MMLRYFLPGALVFCLLLCGSLFGQDACPWESPNKARISAPETPVLETGDKDTYTGTIRVYVVEKESRWNDDSGTPFHNAFLAFALEEAVSVNETDSLTWNLTWDGDDYYDAFGGSYGDLTESNVKVIAAVFNSASYTGYSDPPSGRPFNVHEVDAVAGAMPGETGYNERVGEFTHSVLVEDGSTTW
jgi:hypothetical protein